MKKQRNYLPLPKDAEPKYLGLFVKEKSFYRSFLPLLLIIALQHLALLTVNLVDNIMLGRYSEAALSGATLVNQIQFILQELASGVGVGIVVVSSQYWGKKEIKPIKSIIAIGVKSAMIFGVLFFVLTLLFPAQILGIFTNDAGVIAEGIKYLKIMCWTYLIFTFSNSLMFSLQSVETATIGTVMSVSTIFINMTLNYFLIYGNFGAPELGIRGAAIATLISRCVELAIILIYVRFVDKKLKMKLRELLSFDVNYFKDFIKVATPSVLSGVTWGLAQAAQTAVLGNLSTEAIAANSISSTVSQIIAVVGMAGANAASVIIGKTIGEGHYDKIRAYSKTLQGIFLVLGIVAGTLTFILKDAIIGFYTVSAETARMTSAFLVIFAVTIVGSCYEYPVESGIIGGGGSTKYPAVVDNVFMWLFTIPTAALSAYVFHFGPIVTFCFLKADQLLKCIPNAITCNKFKWAKVLTKK